MRKRRLVDANACHRTVGVLDNDVGHRRRDARVLIDQHVYRFIAQRREEAGFPVVERPFREPRVEHLVHRPVWHRSERVNYRRPK